MVVLSTLLMWVTAGGPALAAPNQAGAVGMGITGRTGLHSESRTHLMAWMRPTDAFFFGAGLGHATTREATTGVSVRLSAGIDHPLTQLGPFDLLIEGGAVVTAGAADSHLVSTLGPTARLVLLSHEEPLSIATGWAPELQPGTQPSVELGATDIALRVWF